VENGIDEFTTGNLAAVLMDTTAISLNDQGGEEKQNMQDQQEGRNISQ